MEQNRGETFAHLAAEFINKESNRQSLITVTGVSLSKDGKRADVLLTVLPEDKEREAVEFLKRKLSDFRAFVKANARGRVIPLFDFVIDEGEKNRQEIEALSQGDR